MVIIQKGPSRREHLDSVSKYLRRQCAKNPNLVKFATDDVEQPVKEVEITSLDFSGCPDGCFFF